MCGCSAHYILSMCPCPKCQNLEPKSSFKYTFRVQLVKAICVRKQAGGHIPELADSVLGSWHGPRFGEGQALELSDKRVGQGLFSIFFEIGPNPVGLITCGVLVPPALGARLLHLENKYHLRWGCASRHCASVWAVWPCQAGQSNMDSKVASGDSSSPIVESGGFSRGRGECPILVRLLVQEPEAQDWTIIDTIDFPIIGFLLGRRAVTSLLFTL